MIVSLFSKNMSSDNSQGIASELELDPSVNYAVLVLCAAGEPKPEGLVNRIGKILGSCAICSQYKDTIVILHSVKPQSTDNELRKLNKEIARKTEKLLGVKVTIGMGRLYSMPEGLQISYQEAEQALTIGKRLFSEGSVSYFGDLRVYRLLLSLKIEELKSFFQEAIGCLVEYDTLHHSHLLITLRELLHHPTGTATAKALHVHRNTLLYRIQRIQEITKLNLDDSETRLTLHLAFKAADVIHAG